jgi:transcriptional regulator with XRE-family HTH domain
MMAVKKPRPIRTTEEETNRIIGRRLWEARAVRGLSLTQLGDRAGLGYTMLQQYEQGEVNITPGKLKALAEALGVTISYLFEAPGEDEEEGERPSRSVFDFMRRLQRIERHEPVLFVAICEMVKTMAKTVDD